MAVTAAQAIAGIHARFGHHPGSRAFHAKGQILTGTFTATPAAAGLTRALHFQGEPVPVTARLSNGAGDPNIPDYAPDVRGLAVAFHLPDGTRTDILGQTAPRFPVRTVEDFMQLVAATEQTPRGALRMAAFLARHPGALLGLRHNLPALRPPPSYAACAYYPIHAFRFLAADGTARFVRYRALPTIPEERISPGEGKKRGRDFLQEELRERIAAGPVAFALQLQVAAEGDDPHDPASVWPSDRELVDGGTIELTGFDAAPDADAIIFDPMRLVDGIEPTDDPILRFRPEAYSVSYELRTAS